METTVPMYDQEFQEALAEIEVPMGRKATDIEVACHKFFFLAGAKAVQNSSLAAIKKVTQ